MFTQILHIAWDLLTTIVDRVLTPIGILFAVWQLAKYFSPAGLRASLPASAMKAPDPKDADEDGKFGSRYLLVQICIVAVGLLFAVSTHRALLWLNRRIVTAEGPANYRIWPSPAMFWFFPGFGALTLAWPIVLQFWSDFISRRAAYSFNYWWAQSAGYDSTRALERLALILTAPMGVLTILLLPTHISLRPHDIRDCKYGIAPCKTYLYSDARRMTLFNAVDNRDGGIVRGAGIAIDFKDGHRWTSTEIGDDTETVDPALIETLKEQTKLPLHHARSEADIPVLDQSAEPNSR